jgi:radical SAM family uncharacterized protein/radical SAM-linked protein
MKLDQLLQQVARPSRYLGGERGSVCKNAAQIEVRFALAFPDVYEVGMSHIGLPLLYHRLNALDWVAAERVYAPWPDLEERMRAAGLPLETLETSCPLVRFDAVGFTLQYELSYTNVLNMLDLAGLPRRRAQRNASHPLIVVGGPGAFNPEPLADFIDCAVVGDGEEAVVELAEALRVSKAAGEDRAALNRRLAAIEGVYVPALFAVDYQPDGRLDAIRPLQPGYEQVRRRVVADLDRAFYPTRPIVPFMNTVHDRVAVEIARGCTRGCRFCQAGFISRPVRERNPATIGDIIAAALGCSGYEEVSLLSLSTGDYSHIGELLKRLMDRYREQRVALSLPSLRVGSLTGELMEEIRKVRKTGFTLAPEAGSERLRQVVNKGITEEDLLETARTAFGLGWRLIKLYFMIGLPTETAEDRAAIVDLAARVKRAGKGSGGADVNVAVSTFVPKPHTPFQWERQLSMAETLVEQDRLREALRGKKLRFKWHEAPMSFIEGVFARGDRRLGATLERAVDLGCRFDGWRDHFRFDLWQQAFADCGLDPDWYLRQRQPDEVLPWDHIHSGIPKAFFLAERERAVAGVYTPDCRHGDCAGCGVCDFETLRPQLATAGFADAEVPPSAAPAEQPAKVRLLVGKSGAARFVSHLEFMTVLHRAIRRADIPVRFSAGFHPAPQVSFPDALPTGVESDAEVIDIKLSRTMAAEALAAALNAELPGGFAVLGAEAVDWSTPAPSCCIAASTYRILLPEGGEQGLDERLATFLAAAEMPVERLKKGRVQTLDLRAGVLEAERRDGALWLTLGKGSPVPVVAWLLALKQDEAAHLPIRKMSVRLH